MKSYPEALECFKEALTMILEILGEDVYTFHRLGGVYYSVGDFTSTLGAFQKAARGRHEMKFT